MTSAGSAANRSAAHMEVLRRGSTGPAVVEVRAALQALRLIPSGAASVEPTDRSTTVYDATCELAVREFQQVRGLSVDGLVGAETYRALAEARWSLGDRVLQFSPNHLLRGDDIARLQERLLEMGYDAGRPDGVFGTGTERGLRSFQKDYGLQPDGTCGPLTLRALRQLGRKVTGGRPQLLRESAQLVSSGPHLVGKRIVVDPGHGGEDHGFEVAGLRESDLVWDLASRIEGRLSALGASAALTRGPGSSPTAVERTDFANSTNADLFLSLHLEWQPQPTAHGVAAYYFGTGDGVSSSMGEDVAGIVHREILARTGMLDCGIHAKTWDLLRLTRMAAVRLDCGYLSHPGDRELLADARFRDTLAEAVLAAVQRMYLPDDLEPVTGSWRLPSSPAMP